MKCVTAAQIRIMEQDAVRNGTPEYELMLRAGRNAARWIRHFYSDSSRFVILCGKGNNGGDALVVASELSKNHEVVIFSTVAKSEFRGCAALAVRDLPDEIPFYAGKIPGKWDFYSGDVIVDGLLGTGFAGEILRTEISAFIAAANESKLPVVALDLPSGLNSDSGKAAVNGVINAELTLTFGMMKPGLFLNDGSRVRGKLRMIDIGLPDSIGDAGNFQVFTNLDAASLMPDFPVDSHKNSRGRVAVWGSSLEYPGAAALTVAGALKSGSGIVRCASEADLSNRLYNAAIFSRLEKDEIPCEIMDKSAVLVCGSGWGSSASPEKVRAALEFQGKVILDADALNCIAKNKIFPLNRNDVMITPHPGEAARLMAALGIAENGCRIKNAAALASALGVVVLLKGRDSVVAAPGREAVLIAAGNALLATAGSGDVLAGVAGAMAALTDDCFDAACLAAYIHGVSGENFSEIPVADELPGAIGKTILDLQRKRFI